ncbi:hypothetical protein OCU04_009086 [Sclerotinia nivalis]|uniref:Uncharacterized protein n=1 Tax=Sclerotinia nivalis TaxID=352851 RepID=A0A9X0AH45_9HELO|nr:hypothetical protein OCU04_009086 [Sclerotinia nivalis]
MDNRFLSKGQQNFNMDYIDAVARRHSGECYRKLVMAMQIVKQRSCSGNTGVGRNCTIMVANILYHKTSERMKPFPQQECLVNIYLFQLSVNENEEVIVT